MSLTNTNSSSNRSSVSGTRTKSKKAATTSPVPGFSRERSHGNITEYKLAANGLTVLCAHTAGSPTVTTNIVYRVGSQHELRGETGLAHMLEHMLFKPTSGTGTKWKDLENRGANLNATTWLDRTLYYFNMPQGYLDDMLAVEADRMRNVLLTKKEFEPERANVLSEYEMYNSRPESALEWHIVATAFQSHGYHHDTIGFRSDIEAYTPEKLRAFYDQHYWPENATLIVAGDIDDTAVLKQVKVHFGNIRPPKKAGGKAAHTRPQVSGEATQEGVRRVSLVRPTPLRYLNIAFKAPAFTSADWLPLSLALSHLTVGETSPLYRALIEAKHATNVAYHLFPTKDVFLASIEVFATEKASYNTIEMIIRETIETLKRKGITETELSLLKEASLSEMQFSRDGSMNIAAELAEYVATGDWTRYGRALDDVANVTKGDVDRVVKEYLTINRATVGTIDTPTP